MRKQTTNTTNSQQVKNKKNAFKNNSRNKFTEADLGEDILTVSLCSVYPAVRQLVNNIYNRSYVFQ